MSEYATHHDDAEDKEAETLVTVAKFRSTAEAGYFADELETAEQIRCVLTSVDDFDAAAGRWDAMIHLRVADRDAKLAAGRLRELISASAHDDDGMPYVRGDADAMFVAPRTWLPIAIAFAAGSLLLFAVQSLERAAVMPQGKRASKQLLDVLAASPEPWVQNTPGGGRRELSAERGGEFVLREDRDADGRFECSTTILIEPQP